MGKLETMSAKIKKITSDRTYSCVTLNLLQLLIHLRNNFLEVLLLCQFPQGGLAYVTLWGLANPRSRSQGGPSGQASRLRKSSMYTAGKVVGSVKRLSTVTLSLRGLG